MLPSPMPPCAQLIPELLELYPDAMVICTVRDPEAWAKSHKQLRNLATSCFLRVVLLPLSGMRHFVRFISLLRNLWQQIYGRRESTLQVYHRHIAWLKDVVPPDRLVFFDVKKGWEPLCRALGKDVPEYIPFPRLNDSEAIDRAAEYYIKKGLTRWAFLAAVGGIVAWFISPKSKL